MLEQGKKHVSRQWLDLLSDEDLAFVERFLLASGSLKKVAQLYGISYPTVRLRLDRLIGKIELAREQRGQSEFELLLRGAFIDGKIDEKTFRALLAAHQREVTPSGDGRQEEVR